MNMIVLSHLAALLIRFALIAYFSDIYHQTQWVNLSRFKNQLFVFCVKS